MPGIVEVAGLAEFQLEAVVAAPRDFLLHGREFGCLPRIICRVWPPVSELVLPTPFTFWV
jgi:hypothetical protein